jgi:hypothetical protein
VLLQEALDHLSGYLGQRRSAQSIAARSAEQRAQVAALELVVRVAPCDAERLNACLAARPR